MRQIELIEIKWLLKNIVINGDDLLAVRDSQRITLLDF